MPHRMSAHAQQVCGQLVCENDEFVLVTRHCVLNTRKVVFKMMGFCRSQPPA